MGMSSTKPADLPEPAPYGSRRSSQALAINVEATAQYAMYQQQGQYAPAPMSAPLALQAQTSYGSVHPMNLQPESATGMKRVESQPLPGARAQAGQYQMMNYFRVPYNTTSQCTEAERQRIRAQVASRRVSMQDASVMQPWVPAPIPQMLVAYPPNGQPRPLQQYHQVQMQQPQPMQQQQQQQQQQTPMQAQQPQILGWESPNSTTPATHYAPQIQQRSNSMGSGPVMTSAYAPLGNVHPPANSFHPNNNPHSHMQSAPVPHKVHPPPHPGSIASGSGSAGSIQQQPRPMARLPSGTPGGRQSRKTAAPGSAKPKPPKTPGKKKNMPVSGIQEHNQLWFANYTNEDGQALLKGVAPSGSQSKRKREATAALLSAPMVQTASGSDISGDEDSRSKRSRSSASSSG